MAEGRGSAGEAEGAGVVMNSGINELFARAKGGDGAAWEELFHACQEKILRVVRRRIDPRMRAGNDSTDFASDVWASFCAKADRLEFASVREIEAFLINSAANKVADEGRRITAQKRDVGRNRPSRSGVGGADQPSSDPSPSQVAVAHETHQQLLEGQPQALREVIALKRQDYSNEEVAARTGQHPRKVQRALQGLKERFTRLGGRT